MILLCSTAHQGKCVFCTPFLTVVHHSIFNTKSINKLATLLRANAVVCIYTEYGQ